MPKPTDDSDASSGETRRQTRRSYDAIAERYAREVGGELAGKPLDRALLASLAELCAGGLVADIGCGPGHVAAHLAAGGVPVVGADLSGAMCALASHVGIPAVAADLAALPLRSASLGGIVCWYAVIHLSADQRAAAYREMTRVLRPGGHALVAFHTSDAEAAPGVARDMTEWWGHRVDLRFRFLDPDEEEAALHAAGLRLLARTDRQPGAGEHSSRRSYLLVRAPVASRT